MKKNIKRIINPATFALITALLLTQWAPLAVSKAVFADTGVLTEEDFKSELNSLNDKINDLKKQNEELLEDINKTNDEREKRLLEKTSWERQIQVAKDEITVLSNRISILEGEISNKEDDVESKKSEIDKNYELYKSRMRAMYMAGEASSLSMVLGANSYTDFLMRTEMVRATAEHDRALLKSLRTDRVSLERAMAELNEDMKLLEEDNRRMDERKKTYESQLVATNVALQDINMLEEEYQRRKKELDEADKKAQAEIDKIYAEIDNSTKFVGGEFGWPVPGFKNITSYYGWRFNNTNFHTGIDISGANVFGASIKASNSGKVIFVQNSYAPGVGYGRHAIVDHGGGYSTLYAHMTSISVKVGDTVARGVSEIGKVGSTGWSTGPHLHFEIRINGKHQNPLTLLK